MNQAPASTPFIPSDLSRHETQDLKLDTEEQIARLSLLQWERGGPWALGWILQHYPSAEAFWREGRQSRRALALWCAQATYGLGRNRDPVALENRIEASQPDRWPAAKLMRLWLGKDRHHILWSHDNCYPEELHRIHPQAAPQPAASLSRGQASAHRALFIEGDPMPMLHRRFAIVGGRSCSDRAAEIAAQFAGELAEAGLVIVSGMAEGIDAAAHLGALKAKGKTIAVMATGIDRSYPQTHQALRARIANQGAVMTTLLPGQRIEKFRFLQRNSIIAALSEAVLVVQARLKSGALSTAHAAAELGKTVFAVPGSIDDPRSKGCHQLIREGASLTERIEDICSDLPWLLPLSAQTSRRSPSSLQATTQQAKDFPEENPLFLTLSERFGHEPFDIYQVAQCLQTGYLDALHQSLRWELQGLIRREPDGRYVLKLL